MCKIPFWCCFMNYWNDNIPLTEFMLMYTGQYWDVWLSCLIIYQSTNVTKHRMCVHLIHKTYAKPGRDWPYALLSREESMCDMEFWYCCVKSVCIFPSVLNDMPNKNSFFCAIRHIYRVHLYTMVKGCRSGQSIKISDLSISRSLKPFFDRIS